MVMLMQCHRGQIHGTLIFTLVGISDSIIAIGVLVGDIITDMAVGMTHGITIMHGDTIHGIMAVGMVTLIITTITTISMDHIMAT